MKNIAILLTYFLWMGNAFSAETTLVNRNTMGELSDERARLPTISSDGNYIAYESTASDLVEQDISVGSTQIYVYNRVNGGTEIVSVDSSGTPGNGSSFRPSISADGRYVAFHSRASNLGSNTSGLFSNAYVYDRFTGEITTVSRGMSGNVANGDTDAVSISANGRYVAFQSESSNLVIGDTNSVSDIFVFDRVTLETIRVSIASDGEQANSSSQRAVISADGRYIAFASFASNLIAEDDNGASDVFRHDTTTGITVIVSSFLIPSFPSSLHTIGNGYSASPSMSDDGRYIVFESRASNLNADGTTTQNILLRDMLQGRGKPQLISKTVFGSASSDDASFEPSISHDAQYVYFRSYSSDLVEDDSNNDWDGFLFSRADDSMERVTVNGNDVQAYPYTFPYSLGGSAQRQISNDGRYITFYSDHNGLIDIEPNDRIDAFLRDRGDDCPDSLAGTTKTIASGVWYLLALPCKPPSSQSTVGDILADDIPGTIGVTWAAFTYDSTLAVPNYVSASLTTRLKPGQGFWVQQITGSSITLDMPSGSRQVTGRRTAPAASCLSVVGCFELPLSGATNTGFIWNLIGNPFADNNQVLFDQLRVTTTAGACSSNVGCSMAEAAAPAANIVFNRFFHFNGTAYVNRELGSTLGAWEGYWVPELPLAEFNRPLIRFPR